jgi:deoxyribonuclease V
MEKPMIYALDVDYNGDLNATVACLGFQNWSDNQISYSNRHRIEPIEPYQSGLFFKRELPCLLKALENLTDIEIIIVDGYVWLEEPSHYGLGMYLYDALDKQIPIIGVAKNRFNNTPKSCELLRGESQKPLYITSIGIELEEAKSYIAKMAGKYRFPSLLKEVDTLCRK